MLISIDHGNYAIKTINHTFVSGLVEHTVKPPMTEDIMEYNGSYWTLSGKRLNYMKDKTQDERFFILSLFAIAKELESSGRYSPVENIDLAVGLPLEHYTKLLHHFVYITCRLKSRCCILHRQFCEFGMPHYYIFMHNNDFFAHGH